MITANQLYKQSKSSLTFKQWLKENQSKGFLDNHEKMYNLIEGVEDDGKDSDDEQEDVVSQQTTTTTQKAKSSLGIMNLVGIVGLGFLIYGLTQTNNN
jgi:hypothetical protein